MSKLRRIAPNGVYPGGWVHWCPGCNEVHQFTVSPKHWQFNGNLEHPTFTPSMKISDKAVVLCHYFLTDGKIVFCGDSPHALAGQTVDLPEWPYRPGEYGGIEE